MRPHTRITPRGRTPGTRPRREPIELSIVVSSCDAASTLPHRLERLQRNAGAFASSPDFLFVDDVGSDGGAKHVARQAVTADAGEFRLSGRKEAEALQQLPKRNRGTKGLLPGSAWRLR